MTDEERNAQNEEQGEERDEERSEDEDGGAEASSEDESSSSSRDDEGDDDSSDDSSDDDSGDGDGGGTTVADVMSKDPQSVEPGDSIEDAAKKMKEGNIGALLVVDGDDLKGIVTDRDIVVNAIAEGDSDAKVEDVCSSDTTTIKPDASLADAIKQMREADVRRLPVVDDGDPVGIVSLGDLAIEADDDSALKDISQASANN
jgi:CBS domain-containing protein